MLIKGEIQTIDYSGNTCTVRMPLFEAAGAAEHIIVPAIIANTPGVYNGYKPGDIVIIGFENGQLEKPIVIGKLYLGVRVEDSDPRGVINCVSGTITGSLAIPANSRLHTVADDIAGVSIEGGALDTTSITKLIDNVQKVTTDFNNSYSKSEEYKTDAEWPIGVWIDGKTIYRRVFIANATTKAGDRTKTIGTLSNYGVIIRDSLMLKSSNVYSAGVDKYRFRVDITTTETGNVKLVDQNTAISGDSITVDIIYIVDYIKN